MSRKQKIIISITGIVLVMLILVGLTYGYFLTRINGNPNDKSISITNATLELKYNDGNGEINVENIEPGITLTSKEFTVENNGNATVNSYAVYLENVENTFERTEDITYILTCNSNKENKKCSGKSETIFPNTNGILVVNSIDVEEIQSYSLTITYKETGTDQSIDMNKKLAGKIQIYALQDIVDLTGTVSGTNNGDYIEMHSTPKKSEIIDSKYLIPAVEPGTHKIYVKNQNGNILGEKTITIQRGSKEIIESDKITITKDSHTVTVDLKQDINKLEVDIKLIEKYNPYRENKNSLAYKIINKVQNSTEETETKWGTEVTEFTSLSEENERVLNTAPDDYGASYYYRGNVLDNYVSFAGLTWRIVRINGDGTVRIVLDNFAVDQNGDAITSAFNTVRNDNAYVGYMYGLVGTTSSKDRCLILMNDEVVDKIEEYNTKETCEINNGTWTQTAYEATHTNIKDSTVKESVDKWYEDNLKEKYSNYIADTLFCNDKSISSKYTGSNNGIGTNYTDYKSVDRIYIKSPELICDENYQLSHSRMTVNKYNLYNNIKTDGNLKYPIGLLTADEALFAGAISGVDNKTFYLNADGGGTIALITPNTVKDVTGETTNIAVNWVLTGAGKIWNSKNMTDISYILPVINLNKNILTTGTGTEENPYKVVLEGE